MAGTRTAALRVEGAPGLDFERYVESSRQRLYRFAVVLCGDPVLAGDLLSNVLGRAFERWHQVSAANDSHAYVRRMLVNEYVDWQRVRARTTPHPEVADLADLRGHEAGAAGPAPADTLADRSALLEELARLPGRQRAAIVLRYYEDLSDQDIAATLDCRVGTVRSSISRGLAALRVSPTLTDDGTQS